MKRWLLVLIVLLTATPGWAGIADSPLPVLLGGPTSHLYSIAGAMKFVNLETWISCTNADAVPVDVGIELFADPGGAPLNGIPGNGSATIPPGGTRSFATGDVAGLFVNHTIVGLFNFVGSARVVATSKKVICTAGLVSSTGQPPTSMTHLTIVKKTKQKASN
jgi:hypothetical protein